MKYYQQIVLKNGKTAVLRNGEESDGSAVHENFNTTHGETDYLLSYPDENSFDSVQEGRFLEQKAASANELELLAIVDGRLREPPELKRSEQRIRFGIGLSLASAC